MSRVVKYITATLFIMVGLNSMSQNQLHHGMYMIHQPYINPASSSTFDNVTLSMMYKSQWTGVTGAPRIAAFNAIKPFGNSSIGLTVQNDQVNINTHTQIAGTFAQRFQVSENGWLSFGLSGVANIMQADLSAVQLVTTNDPTFTNNIKAFTVPNFKFGTYFRTEKFYLGFALPNLLQNKVTFDSTLTGFAGYNGKDLHYYIHGGFTHIIDADKVFNGSALIKNVHGAPLQLDVNAQMEFKQTVGVGVSYRTSNDLLGIFTVQVTPDLKVGYAYEYNMSTLKSISGGSHEVMLIYRILPPVEPVISAPRF